MCQVIKSRRELASETYLKQTEIKRLLKISQSAAHRTYQRADELDNEEFGTWRPEPYKVQLKTVLKIHHTTLSQLMKQIEFEEAQKNAS